MIKEFKKIKIFSTQLAKDYAPSLLRLLHLYKDIAASEAASRLSMHIKTVQEFFDGLHEAGVVSKEEVFESKRPYFRYRLLAAKIKIELDITELIIPEKNDNNTLMIRERKNANARFSISRNNLFISSVSIWIGQGRQKKREKG